MDLEYNEKIQLQYFCQDKKIISAIISYQEYIMKETICSHLSLAESLQQDLTLFPEKKVYEEEINEVRVLLQVVVG